MQRVLFSSADNVKAMTVQLKFFADLVDRK